MVAPSLEPTRDPSSRRLRAKARWLRVEEALARVDQAIDRPAILVKGAALASELYPQPWERSMNDIDLLCPAPELVADDLRRAGADEIVHDDRPRSGPMLGERQFLLPLPGEPFLVEVHRSLDKVAPRQLPLVDILQRASRWRPGSQLWVPSAEDSVLLVVQHGAASDFHHRWLWSDLERLLPRVDPALVRRRAREWRLETALWVAMAALAARGVAIPPMLESSLPVWRRRLVARWYRPSTDPVASSRALGVPWVVRQCALRDDVGVWLHGVLTFALARGPERVQKWWTA